MMQDHNLPGTIAGSLASGLMGALVALGIPWPMLAWGVIGSIIGLSWAPESGRIRSLMLFLCSGLCAAKFGVALSVWMFSGHPDIAGAISCGLGILMHPLLSAVVENIPAYVARKARK